MRCAPVDLNIQRYRNHFKRVFQSGIRSIFGSSPHDLEKFVLRETNDGSAIAKTWRTVGNYIRKAMLEL